MFVPDVLVALRKEAKALSAVLHTLDPPQFDRPTNCPPWDLRELVVQTAASVGIRDTFPSADPQSVLFSAADYYRRTERDTSEYRQRNVDRTRQLSQRLLADSSLARPAQSFDDVTRDAVDELHVFRGWRVPLSPGHQAHRVQDKCSVC